MKNETDALTITAIIESLMDYSRQLIIDEETDGQDYGSAAVVDGITFMRDFSAKQNELRAEVETLKAQRDELLSALCKIDVLGVLPHTASETEFKKAYAEMAAIAMMAVSKIGGAP